MANIIYRDQLGAFVCMLRTPLPNGQTTVGTGTFFVKDNVPFLLTAHHVAGNTNMKTQLVINHASGNAIVVDFRMINPSIVWRNHPVADLAICPLNLSQCGNIFDRHFIPYEHIDVSQNAISRDVELTVVGFPSGLGIQGRFSPLTFRSYAASSFMTMPRADTQNPSDFFCLEQPSMGGYSGGPVLDLGYRIMGAIKTTDSDTKIKGVVHGTLSDATGGKLALVTPTYYLRDIV